MIDLRSLVAVGMVLLCVTCTRSADRSTRRERVLAELDTPPRMVPGLESGLYQGRRVTWVILSEYVNRTSVCRDCCPWGTWDNFVGVVANDADLPWPTLLGSERWCDTVPIQDVRATPAGHVVVMQDGRRRALALESR